MHPARILLVGFACCWPFSPLNAGAAELENARPAGRTILQQLHENGTINFPKHGPDSVTFVVGNGIWQPGQDFKSGADWLALACTVSKGCTLEPAVLTVKQESCQGHYDNEPTQGQNLSFSAKADAHTVVAWFQTPSAAKWLKPGAVPTYYAPGYPSAAAPADTGTLSARVAL